MVYRWFQTKLLTYNYISTGYQENNKDLKKNDIKDLSSKNLKEKLFRKQNSVINREKLSKGKRFNKSSDLNIKIKFCKNSCINNLIKYLNKLTSNNSRYRRALCHLKQIHINFKKNNTSQKTNFSIPIENIVDCLKNSNISTYNSTKSLKNTDKNNYIMDFPLLSDKKRTADYLKGNSENFKNINKNNSFLSSFKQDAYFSDDDSFEIQTNFGRHCSNFNDNFSSNYFFIIFKNI